MGVPRGSSIENRRKIATSLNEMGNHAGSSRDGVGCGDRRWCCGKRALPQVSFLSAL